MKERPILFSAPMVRAILDGRKTQTRRLVKLPEGITEGPWYWAPPSGKSQPGYANPGVQYWTKRGNHIDPCPYGQPGDRLWVRETWASEEPDLVYARAKHEDAMGGSPIYYRATEVYPGSLRWRPSLHMPRWASRINLEVTEVRVERLQEISANDILAEGVRDPEMTIVAGVGVHHPDRLRAEWRKLWESIHGPGSWDLNPWVWPVSFRRAA